MLALTQCTALLADVPTVEGVAQALLMLSVLALVIDCGEPLLFGAAGWKIVPEHFAERSSRSAPASYRARVAR